MQPWLSLPLRLAAMAFLLAAIWAGRTAILATAPSWPTASEGTVALTPIDTGRALPPGWTQGGAWRLDMTDKRLRGLSGLDITEDGRLAVVSDDGWLIAFDPPAEGATQTNFTVQWLEARRLRDSDAEAVLVRGDRLAVSFERNDRVEWVDAFGWTEATDRFANDFGLNMGIEGLAPSGNSYVAFSEAGDWAGDADGRRWTVEGAPARLTGADALDDRFWLLFRSVGWRGFGAHVGVARMAGDRILVDAVHRLPLGPFDNAEGIAIRERGDGTREVWIVTDDNKRAPQRTILVRYDVAKGGWPASGGTGC